MLLCATLLGGWTPAQAEQPQGLPFSYYTGAANNWAGTVNPHTQLRAAIYIPPYMAGGKITGLTVEGVANNDINQLDGWLKSSLSQADNVAFSACEWQDSLVTALFETPYEIPAEGLYAGYTINSAKLDPVPFAPATNEEYSAFIAVGDDAFKSYAGKFGALTITAYMTGFSEDNAVGVVSAEGYTHVTRQEPFTVCFHVANLGPNEVESVEYQYTLNGETVQGSADVAISSRLGAEEMVTVTFAPLPQSGVYPLSFEITRVNGQPNASRQATFEADVNVVAFQPVSRPLMEEATGTWCGWCPRGWLALEKMNELYPDFIGVAWHNNDPMAITNSFPFDYGGYYPRAAINRTYNALDPYKGQGNNDFGIYDLYAHAAEAFGVADLTLVGEWAPDSLSLRLKTTAHFATDAEGYKLGYIIGEDGYYHDEGEWLQKNYYAGQSGYEGTYLEELTRWPSKKALVFNDVVIIDSAARGVEGSLPEVAEEEATYTHEVSFDTSEALSVKGNNLIEDRMKMFAVVMLIAPDGTIKNSRRVRAEEFFTEGAGIDEVQADSSNAVVAVKYFDINGREVAFPSMGVYIRQEVMADGSVKTSKVVMR